MSSKVHVSTDLTKLIPDHIQGRLWHFTSYESNHHITGGEKLATCLHYQNRVQDVHLIRFMKKSVKQRSTGKQMNEKWIHGYILVSREEARGVKKSSGHELKIETLDMSCHVDGKWKRNWVFYDLSSTPRLWSLRIHRSRMCVHVCQLCLSQSSESEMRARVPLRQNWLSSLNLQTLEWRYLLTL